MINLRGTGVAIVTPFLADKSVDIEGLTNLVNHLINGNVEYLVVMGTTGESVTLNKEEKQLVLSTVLSVNNGRLPVVLGIGGNNTQEVVNAIKNTDFNGVSAILSVSPYYNKPTQEGIYQHYKAIANASPLPIILYNVPGRTSSNITASTTLRLANDFENIIAVKEASGNLEQAMQIIKNKPEGFYIVSGDDALTLPIVASGGDGVISVVANAYPQEFSDMVRATLNHDLKTAQNLHYKLLDFINLLFAEGNPGGIKAALKILGICGDDLRLPLVNVSDETFNKIKKEIAKI
jgi:4-hydroxy-tetrahydrodipicolinate synthase